MKLSLNVLMSFLIWTAVVVMGLAVSAVLFRAVMVAAGSIYQLLHN
jgi:hypothetical protein